MPLERSRAGSTALAANGQGVHFERNRKAIWLGLLLTALTIACGIKAPPRPPLREPPPALDAGHP